MFVHALVLQDFPVLTVNHQYAVRSGVHLRFKKSCSPAQFLFRLSSILFAAIQFQREPMSIAISSSSLISSSSKNPDRLNKD